MRFGDAITGGVDLEAGLGIDSIRRLEIVGALKDSLGFSVDESDQQALVGADLDSLVELVVRKLAAGLPPPTVAGGLWTGVIVCRPVASAPTSEAHVDRWTPRATTVAEVVREVVELEFRSGRGFLFLLFMGP